MLGSVMQHTGSLTCVLHLLSNNEFSMLTNLCGRRLHRLIMDHILVGLQKVEILQYSQITVNLPLFLF